MHTDDAIRLADMTIRGQLIDDHATSIVANLLVFGTLAYAAALHGVDRDAYYFSVQEDQYLEWSSFWAFAGAAVIYLLAGRQLRIAARPYWLTLVLAAFCFVVALEEISWGQRLLGYRPPAYFLEYNFQQEFNVHNILEKDFRKFGLQATILGFGVLLPLLSLVPVIGRWFERFGVPSPPVAFAPAFLVTFIVYAGYPWKHTGEWVELMLGLGFLFAGMHALQGRPRPDAAAPRKRRAPATRLLIAWLIVVAAGAASAPLLSGWWTDHAEKSAATRMELEALQKDFLGSGMRARCGVHKRLYTYVEQYDQTYLLSGDYARLVDRGLPAKRAEFLLDPWNSPYWLRDTCAGQGRGRSAFVYSFGPNRRRDSTATEILDDDSGLFILGP